MRLFKYLIVLAIAVLIGNSLLNSAASISINLAETAIEMPLWFAAMLLLSGALLFYLGYSLLTTIRAIPQILSNQRKQSAANNTQRGLLYISQGNYKLAEKYLSNAAPLVNSPATNYVQAAIAAQQQHKYQQRDHYLSLAYKSAPEHKQLIQITQAKLHLEAGEYQHSDALLQQLVKSGNSNPALVTLRIKLAQSTNDWQQVLDLLPKAYKSKYYSNDTLFKIHKSAYIAIINDISNTECRSSLLATYKGLPKAIKFAPEVITAYVKNLLALNLPNESEAILRQALNKCWDTDLITLYGLCNSNSPNKQIKVAEKWLKKYPNDADLLLCLARLYNQQQLWGKSKQYLEASIEIKPSSISYAELGKLSSILGDELAAQQCYKLGIEYIDRVGSKT